ncbi:branched-chain amino acid ABC transporter permease [soil metagenome]
MSAILKTEAPPAPPTQAGAAAQVVPRPGLLDHPLHTRWFIVMLVALALLPVIANALDEGFYTGLASRILIFALAATSLNLILGFGGMVSFGHAAFLGVGAYAVGILAQYGVLSAWISWPVAVLSGALFALVVGSISLRTRGVYFIMITLAFAQMLYYLAISLRDFGGEDGISMNSRSTVGLGLKLTDDATFYYIVLALFAIVFVLVQRCLNARFGHVLQAVRENETRMEAVGFPVYRYKLAAFTIAGGLAGLAGALVANQTGIVTPSLLSWPQSGALMVMVIVGGVGHIYGGLAGAIVLLLIEEIASSYTMHWQFGVGAVLLAVVLIAPNGLMGMIKRRRKQ